MKLLSLSSTSVSVSGSGDGERGATLLPRGVRGVRGRARAWLLAASAWAAVSVQAQVASVPTPPDTLSGPPPSLWEVGMGAGLLQLPHYRGSDQSRGWLLPLPYVIYRGAVFKADRDGARAEFVKTNDLRLDFSVAAGAPTSSKDNDARAGMPDLAPTLEFGPSFIWTMARGTGWRLETRVPLRGALILASDPKLVGLVSTPNLNLDILVGGWDFGVYAGPVFATRRQNAYYYDVAAADATGSRPAYKTGGGYAGSQLVFGTSRRFGRAWVGAFGKVDNLRGAVFEDSPLVRRKQNFSMGIGASWVFWQSDQPAPTFDAKQ